MVLINLNEISTKINNFNYGAKMLMKKLAPNFNNQDMVLKRFKY